MATRRKLKVFQTQLGFYDTVVASSSKAAALRAWGVRRDLFAQGLAEIATDEAAIAAAIASPDTPLKRPAGSTEGFKPEPGRPKMAEIDPGGTDTHELDAVAATPPRRRKPPPDRTRLDATLTALTSHDRDHDIEAARLRSALQKIEEELASLRDRQATLEGERDRMEEEWKSRRRELERQVARARRDFRLAGGED